jgi:hypothetical protein
MARMGGNYGSYEGGSGLADLLSGAVSGFRMGDDLRARRAAEKLAQERADLEAEREARYAADDEQRKKERADADALRRVQLRQQGIATADSVDLTSRVANPEDSVQRAMGDLVRGGGIDVAPTVRRDGQTLGTAETPDASGYNTRAAWERDGNLAADTRTMPDFKAAQTEATGRDKARDDAAARRALLELYGVEGVEGLDGVPMGEVGRAAGAQYSRETQQQGIAARNTASLQQIGARNAGRVDGGRAADPMQDNRESAYREAVTNEGLRLNQKINTLMSEYPEDKAAWTPEDKAAFHRGVKESEQAYKMAVAGLRLKYKVTD